MISYKIWYEGKGKGKVHRRTGHEGPEGEQKFNCTLSLTSALDGGGWSTPRPGRYTPGKDPVPSVQEAGWTPGPVWTGAENLAPTGIRSPDCPARSTLKVVPLKLLASLMLLVHTVGNYKVRRFIAVQK
jgi:hypothetical protein